MIYTDNIILFKIVYKRIVSNVTKCIYLAPLKKGTLLGKLLLSQHEQEWWFLNLSYLFDDSHQQNLIKKFNKLNIKVV